MLAIGLKIVTLLTLLLPPEHFCADGTRQFHAAACADHGGVKNPGPALFLDRRNPRDPYQSRCLFVDKIHDGRATLLPGCSPQDAGWDFTVPVRELPRCARHEGAFIEGASCARTVDDSNDAEDRRIRAEYGDTDVRDDDADDSDEHYSPGADCTRYGRPYHDYR